IKDPLRSSLAMAASGLPATTTSPASMLRMRGGGGPESGFMSRFSASFQPFEPAAMGLGPGQSPGPVHAIVVVRQSDNIIFAAIELESQVPHRPAQPSRHK